MCACMCDSEAAAAASFLTCLCMCVRAAAAAVQLKHTQTKQRLNVTDRVCDGGSQSCSDGLVSSDPPHKHSPRHRRPVDSNPWKLFFKTLTPADATFCRHRCFLLEKMIPS